MANAWNKKTTATLTRDDMVRMLDLPAAEFRAVKAKMAPSEVEELRRVWHEESADAVADYNRYVEERGLPLAKYRMF